MQAVLPLSRTRSDDPIVVDNLTQKEAPTGLFLCLCFGGSSVDDEALPDVEAAEARVGPDDAVVVDVDEAAGGAVALAEGVGERDGALLDDVVDGDVAVGAILHREPGGEARARDHRRAVTIDAEDDVVVAAGRGAADELAHVAAAASGDDVLIAEEDACADGGDRRGAADEVDAAALDDAAGDDGAGAIGGEAGEVADERGAFVAAAGAAGGEVVADLRRLR